MTAAGDRLAVGDRVLVRALWWVVEEVNNRGRPLTVRLDGGNTGVHFGDMASWRAWLEGDAKFWGTL